MHPALVEAGQAGRRDLSCSVYDLAPVAVHATDPLWPPCIETSCPERLLHPMFVEPDLGPDPFWTCHRTGLPVAPVGRLPAP